MIDKKEFKELSGSECPYGRKITLGSRGCENCAFHRVEMVENHHITSARCDGDLEQVQKYYKRIKVIINLLKN